MHFWQFNSRLLKVFYGLKESFKWFLQLLYTISTFQLSIKENSCSKSANVMYGVFVDYMYGPSLWS